MEKELGGTNMRNVERYVGYSLTRFIFDMEDNNDYIIVKANIRGHWNILADGRMVSVGDMLGLLLKNSMIIECKLDTSDFTWFIKIDMDKEGRFE